MSVWGHVFLFGWAFAELVAAEFDPRAQEKRQPTFGRVQAGKQRVTCGASEAWKQTLSRLLRGSAVSLKVGGV